MAVRQNKDHQALVKEFIVEGLSEEEEREGLLRTTATYRGNHDDGLTQRVAEIPPIIFSVASELLDEEDHAGDDLSKGYEVLVDEHPLANGGAIPTKTSSPLQEKAALQSRIPDPGRSPSP